MKVSKSAKSDGMPSDMHLRNAHVEAIGLVSALTLIGAGLGILRELIGGPRA